jgi:nickel-dependent lactate racemase
VAPGVAGQQTIKVIHSPKFMREPMATEGSILENPLHAELLEIARIARHDFILDVTLTQDRKISSVFAGSPVEAHAAAVEFLQRTSLETIVVGRYRHHQRGRSSSRPDFLPNYQGITAAQHIAKPGGKILILGECAEGVGSPEFAHKLATFTGYKDYLEEIKEADKVMVDQWQLEKLALTGLQNDLLSYTPGVTKEQLGALGDRLFDELDKALESARAGLHAHARVALVPDGPYVYARVV